MSMDGSYFSDESYFYDLNLQQQAYDLSPRQSFELRQSVIENVGQISLSEVAVLQKVRGHRDLDLDNYSLAYVLPSNSLGIEILDEAWNEIDITPGVTTEYTGKGIAKWDYPGNPYIDGSLGIGLVYGTEPEANRLVALCTGGLTEHGPLIAQIQDVSRKTDSNHEYDPKASKHSGLRHGLDWKQTTVKAWLTLMQSVLPETVYEMEGKPCHILPAHKNFWATPDGVSYSMPAEISESIEAEDAFLEKVLERFKITYDNTAEKLGGKLDPHTGFIMLSNEWNIPYQDI